MGYKTILVDCDATPQVAQRLEVAVDLAQRHSAHLVGVHVQEPFDLPVFTDGTAALDTLYEAYEATAKADLDKASAAFAAAVKDAKLSTEWRVAKGYAENELVTQARYADLTVLGQASPDIDQATPAHVIQTVALSSGRPTLIVPHIGVRRKPGGAVMLCWNESRESARAASDALPFLATAQKVVVLIIDPHDSTSQHEREASADITAWLGHHGIEATVQRDVAADGDVGSTILSRAADHDIDLIVMGVYGHSRVREMVLGGASRTLLSSMTAPLLMAH